MSHTFAREDLDGCIRSYDVSSFWEATKDIESFDLDLTIPVKCINSYINKFTPDDWRRVMEADLSYPIILNDISGILDGCHRTVRATMLGYTTIRVVTLNSLPEPIRVWKNWDDYDENP